MSKGIVANLGFLLQTSGLLSLLPVLVGLVLNETEATLGILLTGVVFMGFGFLLNALCERKDLDFQSSCVLFVLAFLVISIVGATPFFYLDPFNSASPIDRFTNSVFESVSGFTTTGFSLITEDAVLPQSLLLYRSIIELAGGIGIVFLLLVFFLRGESLENMRNAIGVESLGDDLKKTYMQIFLVYGVFIVVFTGAVMLFGAGDPIYSVCLVIDTLTGGFSPSRTQFAATIGFPIRICLLLLMFLGSVSFSFNYRLFTRKLSWRLPGEVKLYLAVILIGSLAFTLTSGLSPFDSLFHVVSMSSSTGSNYIDFQGLNSASFGIILLVTLIGGCGFSMAGGIKMFRVLHFTKSIKNAVVDTVRESDYIPDEPLDNGNGHVDMQSANVSIVLFLATLFGFSILLCLNGLSFSDSLFEVGSALSTNGATLGAVNASLPLFYKYMLMFCMLIGRVEIITMLVAVYAQRKVVEDIFYRLKRLLHPTDITEHPELIVEAAELKH
jgi:trk system potassium uptake protein TrkH